MPPTIPTYGDTCLPIDSHIQHIVLATEETTVTQQVSLRPIKCQSRSWSHRVTTVDGSHNGESPLLKPTGIKFVTNLMLGTTNGEHRKLIGVKTMSLFRYEVQFVLSGVLPVFHNLNYKLQRRLPDVLPNQQTHQKCVQRCTCAYLWYPIRLSLQYYVAIALVFWKGTVARLSRHD